MATEGTTTRRELLQLTAIGVAGVGTAAAVATNLTEASVRHDFATAWLKEWTKRGGDAHFVNGGLTVGWREYDLTAAKAERDRRNACDSYLAKLSAKDRASVIAQRDSYESAYYDGAMRVLVELLETVDGGKEAVKAIVAQIPGKLIIGGRA